MDKKDFSFFLRVVEDSQKATLLKKRAPKKKEKSFSGASPVQCFSFTTIEHSFFYFFTTEKLVQMTEADGDDSPVFETVTVHGADALPEEIEARIVDINAGNRKWEMTKTLIPGSGDPKVTVYFTDRDHITASYMWSQLAKCSKKYTAAKIVVKNVVGTDPRVADSKVKSRMDFYYGGVVPLKTTINLEKNKNIVVEYSDSFPHGISTSPEAGGFELLASVMENTFATAVCVDDEGNHCKRKYKVLPSDEMTATPGAYLIKVSNLTTEFYYETFRDMMIAVSPHLTKHRLAHEYALLVLESDLYLFIKGLVKPAAPKPAVVQMKGRGNGMRKQF